MVRICRAVRRLAGAVFLGGAAAVSGCTAVELPDPSLVEVHSECRALPGCCRDHVFVFLINGPDPLDCADVPELRDWIRDLGFIKTYYGRQCHASHFYDEMWRIHCEDPEARFVLIGFGMGADGVSSMVQHAHIDNLAIDAVVTLAGHCLRSCTTAEAANVAHTINLVGDGFCHAKGTGWGDTVVLASVSDHDMPSHPTARETIAHVLAQMAQSVSVREPMLAQPVTGKRGWHQGNDEWSFLQPRANLLASETPHTGQSGVPDMKANATATAGPASPNAEGSAAHPTEPGKRGEKTLIFSSAPQAPDMP